MYDWISSYPCRTQTCKITKVPIHMINVPVRREKGVSGIESRPALGVKQLS